MATPTPDDLAVYLGQSFSSQAEDRAAAIITIVRNRAFSWTRGNGFDGGDANDEISSVILTAAARFHVNPQQLVREQMGALSVDYGGLAGFNIGEQAVLNGYRVTAQ